MKRLALRMFLSALATCGAVSVAQAMSFQIVPFATNGCTSDCPRVILATGEMRLGDAETFLEVVKASLRRGEKLRPIVLIHSPGGNMAAALGIGRVLRAIKATVIVAQGRSGAGAGYGAVRGACASACVFSLMGGVKRVVPDDSRVAVHWVSEPRAQFYGTTIILPREGVKNDDDEGERILRSYMREMGVRPELAAFIRKVPHSSIHFMKPEEITQFRLASRTFK
jgi:hypothetical protein